MNSEQAYFEMTDALQQADRISRKVTETTTADAVTFLPAHLGVVRARVKDLAKMKTKWGLEILEDDDGNRDVRIEDALRIIVPKEHWAVFQEMFSGDITNDSFLNLKALLNEAMEAELDDLREDLKPALIEMFNEQRFTSLDKTIKVWQGRFGISQFVTDKKNILIPAERRGKAIQKLAGDLLRTYGEDRGGLEMLLADMKSNRPLSAYDVFKRHNYLYGSRVLSELYDIKLIFEANIDLSFMVSESIYIDDEDVLDEIEDRIGSIKRVESVLFPVNEKFDVSFFGVLYDVIEEVVEEYEKEDR